MPTFPPTGLPSITASKSWTTGPGISPDALASVFDPFQQGQEAAKKGGTGLGLTIAKKQIELMGGELRADSNVGQGTRVWFEIPLESVDSKVEGRATRGAARIEGTMRLAPGAQVKALVVDDVRENREVLAEMLRIIGCDIEMAASGKEGLDFIRKSWPDIVFMDIRMPDMDGLETIRRLRQSSRSETGGSSFKLPKLVACSASVLAHERRRYLESGFDMFLPKPFKVEQVGGCLKEVLHVDFEEVDRSADSDLAESPQWDHLAVPAQVKESLKDAVSRHSITRLRRCLSSRPLNEITPVVSAHLERLAKEDRWSTILEILDRMKDGS